ncbi:MAG TPA: hypothetical protein VF482_20905 [Trebonia sp.]
MPQSDVSVVPANQASWEDLQAVFGRGAAAKCQCQPGQTVAWGEMNVGSRSTFIAAGFREVSHPTTRRVVMRLDLD